MDVKYTGRSDFREIRTQDLEAQGITGWETTVWARNETKTVQDAGGKWLCDNLGDEFEDKTVTTATASSTGSRKSTASTSSTDTPS